MEEMKKWPVVSIVIAIILALGLFASTFVWIRGFVESKAGVGVLTVTGSAKKQIKADYAVWTGTYSVQDKVLQNAYNVLKSNEAVVKKYLLAQGVPEGEMSISAIDTMVNYVKLQYTETSDIESYRLTQSVEIRTTDVEKISQISKQSTELINSGIEFQSMPPQYLYTKLADLKISMLAAATKDARDRAEKIAANAGTAITGVKSSTMGVFQITPLYSNEISNEGMSDTSSIDKEIMAVMRCEFRSK